MSISGARASRASALNAVESASLPTLAGLSGVRSFSFQCNPPPSANRIWRQGKHATYKEEGYVKWREATAKEAMAARRYGYQFITPVKVSIDLPRKHAGRDLDNCIKPILDAMQDGGLVKNDNLIHEITAKWRPKSYADQERVWVTVSDL
jgi:crossover junction endodeoxyribonuclease RusA